MQTFYWIVCAVFVMMLTVSDTVDVCTSKKCSCVGTVVTCRKRLFTQIPNVPWMATSLDLSYNSISIIDKNIFQHLEKLETLLLQENRIVRIDPMAFQNLYNLRTLNLSSNQLTSIDRHTFQHLSSIETIDLQYNDISVPEFAFITIPLGANISLGEKWMFCRSALNTNRSMFELNFKTKDKDCTDAEETFPSNQKCRICPSSTTNSECLEINKVELCPKQNSMLMVCLNTINYNSGHMNVSENCIEFKECMELESANAKTCAIQDPRSIATLNCNYCCVGKHCSVEQIGVRTRDITFSILFNLKGHWNTSILKVGDLHSTMYNNMIYGLEKAIITDMEKTEGGYSVRNASFHPPVAYFKMYSTNLNTYTDVEVETLIRKSMQRGIVDGALCSFNISDQSLIITTKEFKFGKDGIIYFDGTKKNGAGGVYCLLTPEETEMLEGTCSSQHGNRNSGCIITNREYIIKISRQLKSHVKNCFMSQKFNMVSTVNIMGKLINLPVTITSQNIISNVLSSINILLEIPNKMHFKEEQIKQVCKSLFDYLDTIVNSMSDSDFLFVRPNLAVSAIQIHLDTFKGLSLHITEDPDHNCSLSSVKVKLKNANDISDLWQNKSTIITIPGSIVMSMKKASPPVNRITFSVFRSEGLYAKHCFPRNAKHGISNSSGINSHIVVTSIPNINVSDLQDPVLISFVHINKYGKEPRCMFWDVDTVTGLKTWSFKGCVVKNTSKSFTVCACDRLGRFALLMEFSEDDTSLLHAMKKTVFSIYRVGCIICLLSLIFTLVIYLMFRKLRRHRSSQILMNLCLAHGTSNVIFLVGMQKYTFKNSMSCKIVGALMHYFMLSSLTWMAIQTFFMYLSLVPVLQSYHGYFKIKCCLIGWGLPLVVVVLTVVSGSGNAYGLIAERVCWILTPAFYISFMMPFLLINIVAFALVIHQITKLFVLDLNNDEIEIFTECRPALVIMILFDLVYLFASFSFNHSSTVISFLFALFNSLLGAFIFIFYCVLKEGICLVYRQKLFSLKKSGDPVHLGDTISTVQTIQADSSKITKS